ncbi:uncharacterized protein TNCT_445511 [Trichonephila clavata]|uniref:Uncharacterized protein n=1 Tax=Trichonephila clavata TaxID=2740835 RepID=A0A8X6K9J3_TRICU|nr:uncharacterized protein TNCT_445511 [Trichonephila clavata]
MIFVPAASHCILCAKAIFGRCPASADIQIFISRSFCSFANRNVKEGILNKTVFVPQERRNNHFGEVRFIPCKKDSVGFSHQTCLRY